MVLTLKKFYIKSKVACTLDRLRIQATLLLYSGFYWNEKGMID